MIDIPYDVAGIHELLVALDLFPAEVHSIEERNDCGPDLQEASPPCLVLGNDSVFDLPEWSGNIRDCGIESLL